MPPRKRSLKAFSADRTSGAAELALWALDLTEEAIHRGINDTGLERLRRQIAAAHPAMGAVWNAAYCDDPAAFRRKLERAHTKLVKAARRLIHRGAHVVTLSYSSTVVTVLSRKDLFVTVLESLPGGEGQKTARYFHRAGVRRRLVPDAECAGALESADLAVVGADAVTPRLVVNKVGTTLLALAARKSGKPCYVLADSSKLVPTGWQPPPYTTSRPFETTRRSLFTAVVTEER